MGVFWGGVGEGRGGGYVVVEKVGGVVRDEEGGRFCGMVGRVNEVG